VFGLTIYHVTDGVVTRAERYASEQKLQVLQARVDSALLVCPDKQKEIQTAVQGK
jgi:hypothetical protein